MSNRRIGLRGWALLALGFAGLGATLPARAETVRVTVSYYSAATGPYFEKMAAAFHAANPTIDVKIDVVNWDALLQKLRTDISGGVNSDISIIGTRWLLDFVHDGMAEPLDGYMSADFKNRFIGQFLQPSQIEGKTYGLPIAASARAMFYNKAMLTKAGFPNGPSNWDDVAAAAEKIKADGSSAFGLMAKGTEVDVYYYYALWSYGGDVIGPDKKAAFNSPAGVKALTLYKSLVDRGLTEPGVTNYTRTDLQELFKQGRVGMVISLPFMINQIAKEAPNLDYGIVPVPMGTTRSTYAVTDSIVMFSNSKVKQAAWKFLDYLFTKDPRVEFSKAEGFLPTTKEEAADPTFADNARVKVFVDLLPTAHFAPTITGWEDTAKAVTDAVQAVYIGKMEPDAALKQAAERANQSLKSEPGLELSVSISAPTGTTGRVRTAHLRPRLAPWLLILPSLVLGILIIGYPFYEIIRLSFSDVSRFGLVRGYAGLDNFRTVFADPIFREALGRTFTWVAGVVGGTILASIPVALILRRDFYGRGLARTLIMLPWSISLAMAAVVWLWSFNADYGMVNATLQRLGVLGSSVQWMARPETAFPMEILVGIIVSIPFTSTILLGGLSSIPNEVYEAAAIDGAHGAQSFFYITLPLLAPFINIAIVLNVISVFNSFPIIWVMTQGGPDNSTHILVTYLYELSFRLGRPGQAAAVALAMLAIVFTFTGFYLRLSARAEA